MNKEIHLNVALFYYLELGGRSWVSLDRLPQDGSNE